MMMPVPVTEVDKIDTASTSFCDYWDQARHSSSSDPKMRMNHEVRSGFWLQRWRRNEDVVCGLLPGAPADLTEIRRCR